MGDNYIELAGIVEESYTDGEGIRCTIFTQGCSHNCPGCQNPEAQVFGNGTLADIDKLVDLVKDNQLIDGITLSGGDPMFQAEACTKLCKRIKEETSLSIWCYTGFTWEELLKQPDKRELLNYIDVLVDGRYVDELRSLQLRFRGSSNQRIIDVPSSLKTGTIQLYSLSE